MFINESQKVRAILALVERTSLSMCVGDRPLFENDYPTADFVSLVNDKGISHSQQVLAHLALDVWNWNGDVKVSDLMTILDDRNRRAAVNLLAAMVESPVAVEWWLANHNPTWPAS